MPQELPQHRVLKIFIGSPGDLQEERKIARDVVQRVNKTIGRHLRVHVELRGWEDTLPGYTSRPQEKINEDLRECDIFLGLMWKRWGTPPRDDGEYTSGFEEEYHVALEQREADRMREIFLYFKEMPDALREDPGPQASKVLGFRRSVEQGRKVLFHTFEDAEEWEEVLRDHLDEHLAKNFVPVPEESEQGQRTRQTENERETGLIEAGASLEQILGMLQDPEAEASYLQIARASLYTTSLLYNTIHTDHLLDTGQIQDLYAHKEQIELEQSEGWLILRTLLGDRGDVNAGWYWIDPDEDSLLGLLAHLAANDELESVRLQALRLLQAASTDTYRETIHQIVEEAEDDHKVKALNQFAPSAREVDLEFLRPIATQEEGDIAEAAWRGVLVALSHQDPNAAVDWIIETHGPQRGHFKDVLDRVLEDADSGHVREVLTIKDESARFKAMEEVKGEMKDGELRDLTQDDNLDIATAAFMELIVRGHEVDEDEIDEHLATNQEDGRSQYTSLLGRALATYPSRPKRYTRDDVLYELYKTREKEELRSGITWSSIKSPIRYAALADQNYDEFETTLKEDIASGFERIRSEKVEQLESAFGTAAEGMIENLDEYEGFIRGAFYRAAFQVLAQRAKPDDLEIARSFTRDPHHSVLRDPTLEHALDIIGQFGTEEEVDLIEPFINSSRYSLRYKAATMLLELDRERRQEHALELLGQDDWKLKKLAFRYSLDEEDVLPINSVRDLLYESVEQTRLGALAYLVQKLDDREIEDLLDDYSNADDFDFYYYDVICWLDRLVHAPESVGEWYRDRLTETLEETEAIF